MELAGFLVLFPLVAAAVLACVRADGARRAIVCASAAVIAVASVVLAATHLASGMVPFAFDSSAVDYICTAISCVIAVVIVSFGIRYKHALAVALAVIQIAGTLVLEFAFAHGIAVRYGLYLDSLSVIMALVIGIVGSGICVYALGYMRDFQAHEPAGAPDRRPLFFALMFLFLSAMFGIVFSNNLMWMFCAWEVTTVCSFLLIGYTRTEEAIRNAFRQIVMNLAGGIGFLAALYFCAAGLGTLSLVDLIVIAAQYPAITVFPVVCLAFAGLTKAAQMPFHTWLLGAMVAPTPTSALLHSSTMVKAGVFLLIKLAPAFAAGTAAIETSFVAAVPSMMVVLVGGITFALCSLLAISQTNAKRVLAYSTIANLGLIAACAGVGTTEAVWAAIFLLLFHAVAKSLLFLCVGTAEHHIGSRDIEDMDLLFERMPLLARFMMLGIMCMFIAPFGMLVAKWATLASFAEAGQVALIILLAFGSAATFMFWAKWLGKLSAIAGGQNNIEGTVHRSEWAAIGLMAFLILACCAGIPALSRFFVTPYLYSVYGQIATGMDAGELTLCAIMVAFVAVVLIAGLGSGKARKASVYLSGVSADNEARTFRGSLSSPREATARNWYMESVFGEKAVAPAGTVACALIIIAALAAGAVGLVGVM